MPWYEALTPTRPMFTLSAAGGGNWTGAGAGSTGPEARTSTTAATTTPRDTGAVSLELLGLVSALMSALFSLIPSEWAAGRSHALLASVRHDKERKRDRSSTSSPAPARALLALGPTY